MKFIQIRKDDTMNDIECEITEKNIIEVLTTKSISQGNGKINLLYRWNYEDSEILLYGWSDGEAGFENKHDLPPNGNSNILDLESSEQLLFGDIFLIKKTKEEIVDLEISEYGDFYNLSFGGFDDCESTDEEYIENNDNEEDEDYEPSKYSEEEEDEIDYSVDEDDLELDLDTNNY